MTFLQKHIDKINKLFEQRAADWPLHTRAWFELDEIFQAFYEYLTDTAGFKPQPAPTETENQIKNLNALFICGSMKSGTTLITQLLDNHPNLFVLPGDSHFIKKFSHVKPDDFQESVSYWLKRIINPTGQAPYFPYGRAEEKYRKFINYIFYYYQFRKQNFWDALITALIAAFAPPENKISYWVEKTPQNEVRISEILSRYPQAKFIHMLREPAANINSLKKHGKYRNKTKHYLRYSFYLKHLSETALSNQKKYGSAKYRIIHFEELVKSPESIMPVVSDFLNIQYNDTLMQPTINGIPASANSMHKASRTSGKINKEILNPNRFSELSGKEKKWIAYTFANISTKIGYPEWNTKNKSRHKIFLRLPLWLFYRMYRTLIKTKERFYL